MGKDVGGRISGRSCGVGESATISASTSSGPYISQFVIAMMISSSRVSVEVSSIQRRGAALSAVVPHAPIACRSASVASTRTSAVAIAIIASNASRHFGPAALRPRRADSLVAFSAPSGNAATGKLNFQLSGDGVTVLPPCDPDHQSATTNP